MARKFLIPIDLNSNEIRNVLAQLLGSDPGSPVEGQFWFDTTNHVFKFRSNVATISLGRLDQISAPGADVSLNSKKLINVTDPSAAQDAATQNFVAGRSLSYFLAPTADLSIGTHKLTNVVDPGSAQDAATKSYVDALVQGGVYWKTPVRALAIANVTVSAPGSSIDGVSLVAGDRVALAGQSTGSENGLYTWAAAGSPLVRSTDADTSAEVKSGIAFWVNEGTVNADTAWTLSTSDPITLGSTSLTFVQFSGLGQVTAGTGMVKSGNTLNVQGNAGRIQVNADDVDLVSGIATPGTYGSVTVDTYGRVTAGTNPSSTGKYSATIGDGSTTAINVTQATHGLASNGQMIAAAYDASTGAEVVCDISINNSNGTVTFTFSVAPTSNAIRIVIIG